MKLTAAIVVLLFPFACFAWEYDRSQFDSLGAPLSLTDAPAFSTGFYADVVNVLPERENTVVTHPDYFVSANSSVSLGKDAADVKVTFLHEGAGFKNSFGYVAYTNGNEPSLDDVKNNGVIVFPNASLVDSGGNLQYGDTVSLGDFPTGTKLLFFVLANAFKSNGNIRDTRWLFTSNINLNPESGRMNSVPLQQHVAMLWHVESQVLVMGFEDVMRTEGWCDHDFNDVVFTVSSSPADAIESYLFEPVMNSASDNPNIVYSNGIIAFEDLWPKKGDFDFNDVVMAYAITLTKESGLVTRIKYEVTPQAMGASYSNAFKVKLNFPVSNILNLTKEFDGQTFELVKEETIIVAGKVVSDEGGTIIELIDNVKGAIPPPDNFAMANTIENSPLVSGKRITIEIELKTGVESAVLGTPPFDSFISRTDADGKIAEIHRVGTPPTGLAYGAYLGSADDDSVPAEGRYYQTINNQPWVLIIPETWENPLEKVEIGVPYIDLYYWVTSGGADRSKWYKQNIQRQFVFKRY